MVKQPAKKECGKTPPDEIDLAEVVVRHIEEKQTRYSIDEARRNKQTKDDYSGLFNHEKGIFVLANYLENCMCGKNAPDFIKWINWVYRTYISWFLTSYAAVYLLFTASMAMAARNMGIPWGSCLRLLFPFLRRIHDLLTFKSKKVVKDKAKEVRQMRKMHGLDEQEPHIRDFATSHFALIYKCIKDIYNRMGGNYGGELGQEMAKTEDDRQREESDSPDSTDMVKMEMQDRRVTYAPNKRAGRYAVRFDSGV